MKPALLWWLGLLVLVIGIFTGNLLWIVSGIVLTVIGAIGNEA